jgi:hypothetical protein
VYWQRDLGKMAKIADLSFTRGRVRPSQEEGTSFTRGGYVLYKRRVRPSQVEGTSFTREGYVLHKRRVGGEAPKLGTEKNLKLRFC